MKKEKRCKLLGRNGELHPAGKEDVVG